MAEPGNKPSDIDDEENARLQEKKEEAQRAEEGTQGAGEEAQSAGKTSIAAAKEALEAAGKAAEDALILDTLMYAIDGYEITGLSMSVYDIIAGLETPADDADDYKSREIRVLKEAMAGEVNKGYWSTVIMSNPSWLIDGYNDCTVAATFTDADGNVTVAFRGTSDGEWLDSAYAYADSDSEQQQEAWKYFDQVVESYGEKHFENHKLIVTGHSKGGNKAQYVTLMSKYGSSIDNCISFDGQGFSWEAIEDMKRNTHYQAQLEKMYSICGENDFVNVLGCCQVFLDGHVFYIKTDEAVGIGDNHEIAFMFAGGHMGKIAWGGMGSLAIYAKTLSDKIAKLPYEHRKECARTMMQIFEIAMGERNTGVDGDIAGLYDFVGLITHGLPVILGTTLSSKDGREFLLKQLDAAIMDIYEKNGIWGVAGLMLVIVELMPIAVPIIVSFTMDIGILSGIIDRFHHFTDTVIFFAQQIMAPGVNLLKHAAGNAINNTMNTMVGISKIAARTAAENVRIAAGIAAGNAQITVETAAENARKAAGIATGNARLAADLMTSIGEFAVANAAKVVKLSSKRLSEIGTDTARLLVEGSQKILLIVSEIEEVSKRIKYLEETRAALIEKVNEAQSLVERVKAEYGEDYVKRSCRAAMEEINTTLGLISGMGLKFENIVSILKTATKVFGQADEQQASRITDATT